jgi:hypothetical protein
MILTIDTQKDSSKDIQKAIEFLKQFSEQQQMQSQSIPNAQATENFSALFDMPLAQPTHSEQEKQPYQQQSPILEQRSTQQTQKKFFFQTY